MSDQTSHRTSHVAHLKLLFADVRRCHRDDDRRAVTRLKLSRSVRRTSTHAMLFAHTGRTSVKGLTRKQEKVLWKLSGNSPHLTRQVLGSTVRNTALHEENKPRKELGRPHYRPGATIFPGLLLHSALLLFLSARTKIGLQFVSQKNRCPCFISALDSKATFLRGIFVRCSSASFAHGEKRVSSF